MLTILPKKNKPVLTLFDGQLMIDVEFDPQEPGFEDNIRSPCARTARRRRKYSRPMKLLSTSLLPRHGPWPRHCSLSQTGTINGWRVRYELHFQHADENKWTFFAQRLAMG